MSSIDLRLDGQEDLHRRLRKMAGPPLRRLARRVVATAMAPVTATAKGNAPVASGRLRASIGRLASTNRKGNAFSQRVGTRRDFTYRSREDGVRYTTRRGDQQAKDLARGLRRARATAQQYARGIEFGVSRAGKVRRKAGAAHFLEDAIQSHRARITTTVASEIRRHLEST